VKKSGDVSSGGFDWCGLVGRKPCLPAFMGERKVLYQVTTLNRWITVFYSLPE